MIFRGRYDDEIIQTNIMFFDGDGDLFGCLAVFFCGGGA